MTYRIRSMAIKQKIILLALLLGFACSFSVVFSPKAVFAQTPDNTTTDACDAITDPVTKDKCIKEQNPANAGEEKPTDRLDCTGDDPNDNTKCCGGVKTSIISGNLCGDDSGDLKNNSVYKLLIGALNILTAAIGVAAVGGIGYGALLYTTAQNSPEQTKRAISIITNVVIGIVAYGLMYVLLNFLIPGGIFA